MNYLDDDQPFFVLAAVVLPQSKEAEVGAAIRKELEQRNATEFKSAQLLRRHKGRRTALRILRQVGQVALPMFAVHHKRFALGARLVDEFLDFEHNPGAPEEVFRNKDLRRATGAALGELSTEVLRVANEYLRTPNAHSEKRCIEEVATALQQHRPDLAQMFVRAEGLVWEHTSSQPAGMLSPNVGAFMTLASLLEAVGHAFSSRVELIHDEQLEFAGLIRDAQATGRDPSVERVVASVTTRTGPSFRRLVLGDDVVFVDSGDELILQAADLLAGVTMRSIRKIIRGERWEDDAEAELAFLSLGGLLQEESEFAFNLVIPDSLAPRLAEGVFRAFKRTRG